jgi:hypothetical protein
MTFKQATDKQLEGGGAAADRFLAEFKAAVGALKAGDLMEGKTPLHQGSTENQPCCSSWRRSMKLTRFGGVPQAFAGSSSDAKNPPGLPT